MSLLEVNGLNSYYGDSHILFDVSLRVERNEVVALLGRNGAGKSTTLKSLMGVVTPRTGSIVFDGVEIAGKKSHAIAQAGMQLVHEDRRIFGSLNVEENLILAGLTAREPMAARAHLRDVPAAQGAARQPRHRSVRRRTADAGDRPRAGARAEDPTAGRAVRRPGADHRARSARPRAASSPKPARPSCWWNRISPRRMTLADRVYIINNGHIIDSLSAQKVRGQPELLHRHLGV